MTSIDPEKMPLFVTSARALPPGISQREETPTDRDFLAELYASVREEELRPVAWTDAQKQQFLRSQFDLQWAHYRAHYPLGQWIVLLKDGAPIGRLYTEMTTVEARLMDIALVAQERNRGVGTAIMRSFLDHTDRLGLPVTLHVEPFNPALHWYQGMGFAPRETRGIYLFMERPPSPARIGS